MNLVNYNSTIGNYLRIFVESKQYDLVTALIINSFLKATYE